MDEQQPQSEQPSPVPRGEQPPEQVREAQPQPIAAPTVAPDAPTQPPEVHTNSGGILVLQWLTYAFWLWFGISVSVLAGVVLAYVASIGEDNYYTPNWGEVLAYPLAAVLIMTIIAFVTDMLYAKHEPVKKTGAAKVIMLLHVVPFVLMAIGALIVMVFVGVSMLLSSSSPSGAEAAQGLLTPLVTAVLLALAAVRVFFGSRTKVRRLTWLGFGLLAIGFMAAGIVGPVMTTLATKNDRLVEETLPTLAREINAYTSEENNLPGSLTDLKHEGGSDAANIQQLIDKDLVTYKPNAGDPAKSSSYPGGSSDSRYARGSGQVFYYQLCTTYAREKGVNKEQNYTDDRASDSISSGIDMEYYSYSSRINRHPAGEVCYDLYAEGEGTGGVRIYDDELNT